MYIYIYIYIYIHTHISHTYVCISCISVCMHVCMNLHIEAQKHKRTLPQQEVHVP